MHLACTVCVSVIFQFVLKSSSAQRINCSTTLECPSAVVGSVICQCIPDSDCGFCSCSYGFVENALSPGNISCEKVIGHDCSEDTGICGNHSTNGTCRSETPETDICTCREGMYLNPVLNTCVDKPTTVHDPCGATADCDLIPYTVCSPNSVCVCNDAYPVLHLMTKTCVFLPLSIGDRCNFDEDCKQIKSTICIEDEEAESWGTCQCEPNHVEINGVCKQSCISHVNCAIDQYCVSSEYCDLKKNLTAVCSISIECMDENSICDGICRCSSTHKPNPANTNVCIPRVCPDEIQCTPREYCDRGQCLPKLELGGTCTTSIECRGTNSFCKNNTVNSTCECIDGHKENPDSNSEEICILRRCPVDFVCTTEQYCCYNGACEQRRSLGTTCNATIECRGSNVACTTQSEQSDGVKVCNCANSYIPDRGQIENANCIQARLNTSCSASDLYGNYWSALPGETKTMTCPARQNGQVTWLCLTTGSFQGSQPNYGNCSTGWVNDLGDLLGNIQENATGNIEVQNATGFIDQLRDFLQTALIDDIDHSSEENTENQFFGHELQTMIHMVDLVVTHLDAPDLTPEAAIAAYEDVTGRALHAVKILLNFEKPWEQLSETNRTKTFANVLHLINTSGYQLVTKSKATGDHARTYDERAFKTTAGVSETGDLKYFPDDNPRKKGQDSFIQLPPNWHAFERKFRVDENKVYVGLEMNMQHAKKIPEKIVNYEDYDELRLDLSKTMNANMLGFGVGNEPMEFKDGERITITFKHDSESWGDTPKRIPRHLREGEKPKAAGGTGECVIYDEEQEKWTSSGCYPVESTTSSTTCSCGRTGHYAIMTGVHEYVGKDTGLEFVTIFFPAVGGLLDIRQILNTQNSPDSLSVDEVLKIVMAALLAISNLLIVAFVDRTYFDLSDGGCYFIGLLSHFIVLASFTFCLTMSIKIYLSTKKKYLVISDPTSESILTKIFETHPKFAILGICFGISSFIVMITAVVGVSRGSHIGVYGVGDFCWLDGSYIWALFAPGIVTIGVNFIVIYMLHLYVKNQKLNIPEESSRNDSENEKFDDLATAERTVKYNVAFSILTGITWTLAYYQLGTNYSDEPFLQYTFPIFLGLQGALLYWMENGFSEVIQYWNKIRPCKPQDEKSTDPKSESKITLKRVNPAGDRTAYTGLENEHDSDNDSSHC